MTSVNLGVSGSGYPTVRDPDTDDWVYVHRLSAIAEYGVRRVVQNDVHHRDGNHYNSGRENLQPRRPWEHRAWAATD